MDLNDIALFINVVRAGSFVEAGRIVGMPSSTVSRRLLALETSLGVRLLQRTTRRLKLTDAGQKFYAESADRIDALVRATEEVSESSNEVVGRVRVAVPVDFFNWFPINELTKFCSDNPRIRLEFELDDARVDLFEEGIDVALRSGDQDLSLIARPIGSSHAHLVASKQYLSAHPKISLPSDLAIHQCITSPTRGGNRKVWRLIGTDNKSESIEVDGPFQANTTSAQLAGAIASLGIALLPVAISRKYIENGQLEEVLPDFSSGTINVHLVYFSRRQLPRAVSAFIDFAADVIKKQDLL